ncbi:MAG: TIGR02266 family protein [Gemmatimonadota bacterium]
MSDANGEEKRRFPRAPLTLLVQYRFESLEEFVAEYAEDISLGGMFIRTDEPPAKGSMLYLQFTLKDGSKLIEGLAKVAWSLPPAAAARAGRPAGMGVQFISFDEESAEVIHSIVDRGGP